MDGLLNLLPLYSEENQNELKLSEFLESCQIHQSFANPESNSVKLNHTLKAINAKLNNSDSRIEGALLLETLLIQCDTEVFTSNCMSWIQQVMKMLQGPQKMQQGVTACILLGKLLAFSSQFPELSRQISTTVMSQLIPSLCDEDFKNKVNEEQLMEHTLECLKTCMKYFNSSCGPSKTLIEKHLLNLVDSENMPLESNTHISWATCMALLPCLGGSGPQLSQYKSNWIDFSSKVLNSIHCSIGGLFKNINEIRSYDIPPLLLKIGEPSHKNPLVLLHLQRRRFINLCAALTHLLRDPYPTLKNVPVEKLLEMITRIMSVNSKTLSKNALANMDQMTLSALIPDLQLAALNVLIALIGSCKTQLLTSSHTVMNVFVQVLQWTFTPFNQRSSTTERPYGNLRRKVYGGLCLWIAASRATCGLNKLQDALFSQLISDIVVHRDKVQLQTVTTLATNTAQSGRKGRKKNQDSALGIIRHKVDKRANAEVCELALKTASTLLLYYGPRMKPAFHKELQEIVLSILIELMNGADHVTLLPYNDPRCRAALYKLLEKLILCPSPQWPAPINYASAILKNGLNDANLEVSLVCTEALVAIQSILRPRGPTLNFPLDSKLMNFVREEKSKLSEMMIVVEPVVTSAVVPFKNRIEIRMPEESPMPDSLTKKAILGAALKKAPSPIPEESKMSVSASAEPERKPTETLNLAVDSNGDLDKSNQETKPSIPESSHREMTPLKDLPILKSEPIGRKRPHEAETVKSDKKEKTVKLPYGTDFDGDDDLEVMLASFKAVPAE